MPFEIEPGAILRIDSSSRRIKLELYDAPITKALEAIDGVTGLSYVVNDKGVYIWNASNTAAGGSRDPIIGMYTLENGMQIFIPQSQLTPDMREYLRTRTQKQLDKIKQMMKDEGFKPAPPATQPASKPSDDL